MRQSEEMLKLKNKGDGEQRTGNRVLPINARVRRYPLDNFNLAFKLALADGILVTTVL